VYLNNGVTYMTQICQNGTNFRPMGDKCVLFFGPKNNVYLSTQVTGNILRTLANILLRFSRVLNRMFRVIQCCQKCYHKSIIYTSFINCYFLKCFVWMIVKCFFKRFRTLRTHSKVTFPK